MDSPSVELAVKHYHEIGHTAISYSALKQLKAGGIHQFYRYKERELAQASSPSLTLGTLVDEYLLNQEKFADKYVIRDVEKPGSPNQEKFAQLVAQGVDTISEAYKKSYAKPPKTESKLLEKAQALYTDLKDYIDFIPKAAGKEEYSMEDSYAINQIRMNIFGHKAAKKLFPWITGVDLPEHIEIRRHQDLRSTYKGFPIKGELDMVLIDHKFCRITVYDLKSTRSFLKNFKYQANSNDYFLQLFLYNQLVQEIVEEMEELTGNTYTITLPRFIVVRNTGDFAVGVQEVHSKQLEKEEKDMEEYLDILTWHYSNRKFKYDKEYYTGTGSGITKMDYVEDLNQWREDVNSQLSDE